MEYSVLPGPVTAWFSPSSVNSGKGTGDKGRWGLAGPGGWSPDRDPRGIRAKVLDDTRHHESLQGKEWIWPRS